MSRLVEFWTVKKRLERIALRTRSVGLCKAWARWEEQWRQEKKMRRSAEKVVSRRRNMMMGSSGAKLDERGGAGRPKSKQKKKNKGKGGGKTRSRSPKVGPRTTKSAQ